MIILHGDHQLASRQALLDAKNRAATPPGANSPAQHLVELAGSSLTLPDLVSALFATTLLGETNFVVVTDLFSRRPGREKTALVDYLHSHSPANLLVWESKDVTSQLVRFPPAAVRRFDLPKYLFKFLDHFSLSGFHQALTSAAPEQLHALLSARLHDLILVKHQLLTGPGWKTAALSRQAQAFSLPRLLSLHHRLLEIDLAQKTSASSLPLSSALELWVIDALR